MSFRLNDADTEQLVKQCELLSPEELAKYLARVASDPSRTLFDLLVSDGVISQGLLEDLKQYLGIQDPSPSAVPLQPSEISTPLAPASFNDEVPPPPRRKVQRRRSFDEFEDDLTDSQPGMPASAPTGSAQVTQNNVMPVGATGPAALEQSDPELPGTRRLRRLHQTNPMQARLSTGPVNPTATPVQHYTSTANPPQVGAAPATTGIRPVAPAPGMHLPVASAPVATPPSYQAPPQQSIPAAPLSGDAAAPTRPRAHRSDNPACVVQLESVTPPLAEGWPGGVAPVDSQPEGIQAQLLQARQMRASDFHLSVGIPPMIRVDGQLKIVPDRPPLQTQDTIRLVRQMLTPGQWTYFTQTGDLDLCYSFPGGGRYRVNIMQQRNGVDLVCRLISERTMTTDELGLPPQCKRLTEFAQGLVLITGPSGHGKTTTMMALVDMVNETRPDHIITVEEPIEFLLQSKRCQVTQREVGPHTASFATALKAALREDPDIIVIGEMRDYQTTSMAINAAETGHLVFGSLPTQDAAKTIDKVLDCFPPEEQQQIRLMVSESLRGILSQQLVPRKDGNGRVAAIELLFNSIAVANIIREANTAGLVNAMQLGKNQGMVLMDDSLAKLVEQQVISGEEAYLRCNNKAKFAQFKPK